MITVKNLTYDYPGVRALDDISFQINSNTITALVGPNGSGKTTLLKCLVGLLPPFNGDIFIDNVNIVDDPYYVKKEIGFLQDFFGLYESLTIEQALTYFGLAYKIPKEKIKEKIDYLSIKLNLPDRKSLISKLSRGNRQRVAIAQAIVHDPKFLLLDEPASGLDPEARFALGELFIELNKTGMTIIVSSHILAELDQYATDMLVIREEKIIEHSPVTSISTAETSDKSIVFNVPYVDDVLKNVINGFTGIEEIRYTTNTVFLTLSGDGNTQHELLKHLINSNIEVSEFKVHKENIQEKYLNTLK